MTEILQQIETQGDCYIALKKDQYLARLEFLVDEPCTVKLFRLPLELSIPEEVLARLAGSEERTLLIGEYRLGEKFTSADRGKVGLEEPPTVWMRGCRLKVSPIWNGRRGKLCCQYVIGIRRK